MSSFESQPFSLSYSLEDGSHSCTPDFLVTLNNCQKQLQEIKESN
ncbi:TnsA endonuclease N-terminal domain-containing protein [Veronia pacifica]